MEENLQKKIWWPFVFYSIAYYYINGTVAFLVSGMLILCYLIKDPFLKKINLVLPIICMIMIGSVMGLIYSNNTNDYLRDIYYFLQVIVYIYFGFYCEKRKGKRYDLLKSLAVAAFALSILYLFAIVRDPSILLNADKVTDIRTGIGKETFLSLNGLLLMLTGLVHFEHKKWNVFIIACLLLTFVLQFSRASVGTLAIFSIVYFMSQKNKFNKKTFRAMLTGSVIILIIVFILPSNLTTDFAERILRSSQEISSNSVQNWSMDYAYSNWRGYEIHLVTTEFQTGGSLKQLLGYGFGHRVQLGKGIALETLTSIPVFHNGYIQVLNKLGLAGMVLLGIFYFNVIFTCKKIWKIQPELEIFAKYVCALTVGVLFFSYFKGGIFRGSSIMDYIVLIGILYCRYSREEFFA